jgi:hypothetical protein
MRVLRAVFKKRKDKYPAMRIVTKCARVEDPEIVQERKGFPTSNARDSKKLFTTMGKKAASAKPADFLRLFR